MSLAPFSIIVAIDHGNGIAKDGEIPWNSKEDTRFFRETTLGKKRNVVIMGRLTYLSIPEEHRPLSDRRCAVISRTMKQENHPDILVYASFVEALAGIGNSLSSYDEVFVAGGEQLYREAIVDYAYLCQKIYVTKFKTDYHCDQFFPMDLVRNYPIAGDPVKTRDYTRFVFTPKVDHDEYGYLRLLDQVREYGEPKPDRTGVGVRSIFGTRLEFDLRERLPVLTTKKIFLELVIKELLFFISGKTDGKILEEQGVKIWKANTTVEALASRGLIWNEGDLGPSYGHQWRHWNAPYTGCDSDYTGQGIDQLQELVQGLKEDPHGRRHLLTAWNPEQNDQMCLPPCHCLAQFNVSSNREWLDCQLYQRSADLFLGVPFNITSYCLLTAMIGHVTGLKPRRLIHVMGDSHIYNNHIEQVLRQSKRTPRCFPLLKFRESHKIHNLVDFTVDSFIITNYTSWSPITAEMAV